MKRHVLVLAARFKCEQMPGEAHAFFPGSFAKRRERFPGPITPAAVSLCRSAVAHRHRKTALAAVAIHGAPLKSVLRMECSASKVSERPAVIIIPELVTSGEVAGAISMMLSAHLSQPCGQAGLD
jgi:hypothetical protein